MCPNFKIILYSTEENRGETYVKIFYFFHSKIGDPGAEGGEFLGKYLPHALREVLNRMR